MKPRQIFEPPSPIETELSNRYEEFLRLFARDRERLYGFIFSLLPHHADAEDVFQKCSLLLWRKFGSFETGANFLAWARGFAHLEVRNFLKVAGRDRLRFDLDLIDRLAEGWSGSPEQDEERLAALRLCLAKLEDSERKLIEHVYHGDRSVRDLAEMTGLAAQTLYNQLSRIRHKLFLCMRNGLAPRGCP